MSRMASINAVRISSLPISLNRVCSVRHSLVVRAEAPASGTSQKLPQPVAMSQSATSSEPSLPVMEPKLKKSKQAKPLKDLECFASGDSVVCETNFDVVLEEAGRSSSVSDDEGSVASTSDAKPESLLSMALLVFPFFAWGTSMPALKLVMPHIASPLLLGAIRLLPAGILLVLWAAATGRKHPTSAKAWLWIAAFSIIDGAAFQGFLAEGLTKTGAGLGSIIIDSQPLTVAVLAAILFGEQLGPTAVSGLLLGVVGLLLVELPVTSVEGVIQGAQSLVHSGVPAFSLSSLGNSGEFWMLMAAQSMAVGTVMVRYVTKHADSVYATGYHMLFGGLMLLAGLAVQDPTAVQEALGAADLTDAGILTYISLIGGAASYGIFFYNASVKGNLTALSSLTFLTPLFALGGGFAVLGETLTPQQLVGATVTLSSVWLINHRAPASK